MLSKAWIALVLKAFKRVLSKPATAALDNALVVVEVKPAMTAVERASSPWVFSPLI